MNQQLTMHPQPTTSKQASNPFVFIGGCPRSGTTLLQRMLDNHPQLAVANDTHFIPRALRHTSKELYRAALGSQRIELTDAIVKNVREYHRFYRLGLSDYEFNQARARSTTYRELVAALFDEFARKQDKPFAGEKTPDYVRYVPLLHELFPIAKFVHIVRDGRDVALSLLNWAQPDKGPGRLDWWNQDAIATSALWWQRFAGVEIESGDWNATIRYEDLLDNATDVLEQVAEMLGLPFDHAMLQFHRGKPNHGKPTSDEHGSAKSRWLPVTRGLRDWRTQMSADDVAVFELLAGDLLQKFGYELSGNSPSEGCQERALAAQEWWVRRHQPSEETGSTPGSTKLNSKQQLPQLNLLFDGQRFSNYVASVPDQAPDIPAESGNSIRCELTPSYVRRKPDRNCLVSYRDLDGHPWGFAIAHRTDANDKLDKAESVQNHFASKQGVSAGVVGSVDRDQNIITFRFPFDPEIPALADLFRRRGVWQDVLEAHSQLSMLAYKPLRRAVIRSKSVLGEDLVIRLYSQDDYVAARRVNKAVAETQWYQAKLIDHSDRHCFVVTEWLDGESLVTAAISQEDCVRAAGWLAKMHQAAHPKLPMIGNSKLRSRLESAISDIVSLLPELDDSVDRIHRRLLEAFGQFTDSPVFSHGDFYADQLISNEQQLHVVDWDNACNAPRGMDLGNFIAHLEWQAARTDLSNGSNNGSATDGNAVKVEVFQQAYADWHQRDPVGNPVADIPVESGATNESALPDNLPVFVAYGILRVATQSFRRCEPLWRDVTRRLIQRAEHWLQQATKQQCAPLSKEHKQAVQTEFECTIRTHLGGDIPDWLRPALGVENVQARLTNIVTGDFEGLTEAKVLRFVPGRRCVLQFKMQNTDGTCTTVIGKVRAKGLDVRAINALNAIQRVWNDERCERDPVFAEVLGAVPDWNIWFQSSLGGQPADRLLTPDSNSHLARRIGIALGRMHAKRIQIDRVHTLRDEIEILEKGLALRHKRPHWESDLRRLYGACRELIASLSPHPVTGIHRDFYPAQVLCTEHQIAFVDCDLLAMGHPAIDVANFVAHLRETALRVYDDPAATKQHETGFVEGYRSEFPLDENAFRVLRLTSLARHIHICHRIDERKPFRKPMLDYCLEQLKHPK